MQSLQVWVFGQALRLQFTRAPQKLDNFDESQFLLWHLDGRVRIWCKQHDARTHPAWYQQFRLVVLVEWYEGYFLGTLCRLSTSWALFKPHSLCIIVDHVHPFMTTVYPSFEGYFQQDDTPCHKAQTILTMSSLKWLPRSPNLWDCIMNVQQIWCYHVNINQNLWEMFPALLNPCSSEGKMRPNMVLARCA